jgi:hypothetical protein
VLKFFDPSKNYVIQADASQHVLGACLLQEGNPIAYASRSLSATETNYTQIEKERFAIVFACTKFHQYIYGKNVMIHTGGNHQKTSLQNVAKTTEDVAETPELSD